MEANNHIGIYLKLHKVKDITIIKKLSEVGNKQGYIKELILKNIEKEGKRKWLRFMGYPTEHWKE